MKRLEIPAGAKGELGYIRDVLARNKAPGSGPTMFSDEFVSAAFAPSIELLDMIAKLRTDEETSIHGRSGDQTHRDLEDVILRAREIVGDPEYPNLVDAAEAALAPDPERYPDA